MSTHHERPIKRTNPSGRTVWVARYTGRDGKRRSAGTFDLKRDAQEAINAAYEQDLTSVKGRRTVGGYFDVWLDRWPRAERTERSYKGRVRSVLDVEVDGRALRDWPLDELDRGHALDLVDHMLRVQGRAAKGAKGVITVLGAMAENAITDGHVKTNPFRGVQVRAGDRRVQKAPREIRTWSWDQMHAFARAAAVPIDTEGVFAATVNDWRIAYAEAMVRVLSDCGLRLGEALALERRHWHGDVLEVRQTVHRRVVQKGTKTDHGEASPGREVPVPAGLEQLLRAMPPRLDTPFLFPQADGLPWEETNWYRRIWTPAKKQAGIDPRPHEFRHSWVSLLASVVKDPADLAAMAGHSVATMHGHYTHALKRSQAEVREAIPA